MKLKYAIRAILAIALVSIGYQVLRNAFFPSQPLPGRIGEVPPGSLLVAWFMGGMLISTGIGALFGRMLLGLVAGFFIQFFLGLAVLVGREQLRRWRIEEHSPYRPSMIVPDPEIDWHHRKSG